MAPAPRLPPGLHFDPGFLRPSERAAIRAWLATLHPIREQRYPTSRPPPDGASQRWLLRPVWWIGGWQFACLDYYHPPQVRDRVVCAEPMPPVLAGVVARITARARAQFRGSDLPSGWQLNTALVNFYGDWVHPDGRRDDSARVGDHRDYEPGPVASISLGERALFQFVSHRRELVKQQWLGDGSLLLFGGGFWKDKVFHRVQRVEDTGIRFPHPDHGDLRFETRRINLTFRFVPVEHLVRFRDLPPTARADVAPYVDALATHSTYWQGERP